MNPLAKKLIDELNAKSANEPPMSDYKPTHPPRHDLTREQAIKEFETQVSKTDKLDIVSETFVLLGRKWLWPDLIAEVKSGSELGNRLLEAYRKLGWSVAP